MPRRPFAVPLLVKALHGAPGDPVRDLLLPGVAFVSIEGMIECRSEYVLRMGG